MKPIVRLKLETYIDTSSVTKRGNEFVTQNSRKLVIDHISPFSSFLNWQIDIDIVSKDTAKSQTSCLRLYPQQPLPPSVLTYTQVLKDSKDDLYKHQLSLI